MKKNLIVLLLLFVMSVQAQQTAFYINDNRGFERGLEMLSLKNYTKAQDYFEQYFEQNKADVKAIDASYYIGYCALHLNQDTDRGESLLLKWREKYPKHPKAVRVNVELAKFYYGKKKYKEALSYYEQVDGGDLDEEVLSEIYFEQAYSYFMIKDLNKAELFYDKCKNKEHQYTYAANYYSGYIKFKHKKYEQSLEDFKKAEKNKQYAQIVPFMIANIYYQQAKDTEVIEYGEQVLAKKKGGSKARDIALLVAESSFNMADYAKAYKFYSISVGKRGTNDRTVNYKYAYVSFLEKQYDPAILGFNKVMSENDLLGQYSAYYLAQSYIAQGNKNAAVLALKRASEIDEHPVLQLNALYDYARLSYELKNYDDAILAFKKYTGKTKSKANKVKAEEFIAQCYTKTHDYAQAIKYIEGLSKKTQQIKKTYQLVTLNKGLELFNHRKYEQANQYFRKSIKYPIAIEELLEARYWRAESKSLLHKWKEASWDYVTVLKKASEDNEVSVKANYGMAYTKFNTKKYKEAKKYFERYIAVAKTNKTKYFYGDALLRLGDCLFFEKKYSKARDLYQKAITENIKSKEYGVYQIAKVYRVEGKRDLAVTYLDKLLTQGSKGYVPLALMEKGDIYYAEAKYEKAKMFFLKFLKLAPEHALTVEVLYKLGNSYKLTKEYEQAVVYFDRIVRTYCEHYYSEYSVEFLSELYTKLNTPDKFQEVLTEYKKCADPKQLESIAFRSAGRLFDNIDYEGSAVAFTKFVSEYPSSLKVDEAKYKIAESYYYTGKLKEAIPYYEYHSQSSSQKHYQTALIRLAIIAKKLGDYEQAIGFNQKALIVTSTPTRLTKIYSDLTEINYLLGNYDESKMYANKILNMESKFVWVQSFAQSYLAKSSYKQGNLDDAWGQFELIKKSSDDIYSAESHYFLSKILYDKQKYKEAIDSCSSYGKQYSSYVKWFGKSFLLKAESYVQLEQKGNAIVILESLHTFPDEKVVIQAGKRLEELRKVEIKTDTSAVEDVIYDDEIQIEDGEEVQGE